MGSFHTPGTKKKSKQLMQKGQPGPIKAQVQASGTKYMVFGFFNNKGVLYTNFLLRDTIVNAIYILGSLTMFLKHFKKIRPESFAGTGFSTGTINQSTLLQWCRSFWPRN